MSDAYVRYLKVIVSMLVMCYDCAKFYMLPADNRYVYIVGADLDTTKEKEDWFVKFNKAIFWFWLSTSVKYRTIY